MNEMIEERFSENNDNDNEIDLRFLFNSISRNKIFISTFSGIFFVLFCIYGLLQKRVYEGQFQIVLDNKKESLNNRFLGSSGVSDLVNFDLGGSSAKSLNTEVGILNSQSVLMPVFEYVLDAKRKKDKNIKMIFSEWKEDNLKIKLLKGTSILEIKYKDIDKKLINNVLEKIGETYQIYSGLSEKKSNKLQKEYLISQINLYKKNSKDSINKLQTFAIDKDLEIGGIGSNFANCVQSTKENNENKGFYLDKNISIERLRIKASNEIRNIDLQIKKIENLGNNIDEVQYIFAIVPELYPDGTPKEVIDIEKAFLNQKSRYTNKDPNLKLIMNKRKVLVEILQRKTIGYLKAKRLLNEAVMEAATRPKETLLKYKELTRNAINNERILIQLESQLKSVELTEAKLKEPWRLISKPTTNDIPIYPQKKIIAFIGLILGFLFSSLIAIYKEKKSGKIYEEEQLEKILNSKVIEKFSTKKEEFLLTSKSILLEEIIKINQLQNVVFISSPDVELEDAEKLLNKFSDEYKFKIVDKFSKLKADDLVICLAELGKVRFSQLNLINSRLKSFNKNIFGIILLIR